MSSVTSIDDADDALALNQRVGVATQVGGVLVLHSRGMGGMQSATLRRASPAARTSCAAPASTCRGSASGSRPQTGRYRSLPAYLRRASKTGQGEFDPSRCAGGRLGRPSHLDLASPSTLRIASGRRKRAELQGDEAGALLPLCSCWWQTPSLFSTRRCMEAVAMMVPIAIFMSAVIATADSSRRATRKAPGRAQPPVVAALCEGLRRKEFFHLVRPKRTP